MHGSQEIMVDNLPNPEGGARGWGVVIYHNSHGDCTSTDLYPTVDWSMDPLQTDSIEIKQRWQRTIQLEPSTELADWGG